MHKCMANKIPVGVSKGYWKQKITENRDTAGTLAVPYAVMLHGDVRMEVAA